MGDGMRRKAVSRSSGGEPPNFDYSNIPRSQKIGDARGLAERETFAA